MRETDKSGKRVMMIYENGRTSKGLTIFKWGGHTMGIDSATPKCIEV